MCLPQNWATVNVSAGCLHRCVYCFAAGYRHNPTEALTIRLYTDLVSRMQRELATMSSPPRRLHLSPSVDPFQPLPEVQRVSTSLLRTALSRGMEAHFITKGYLVLPETKALILAHRACVFITVGLITTDPALAAILEPGAAPPADRLALARWAVSEGVHTCVRVAPVLPGVTDSDAQLEDLFGKIDEAGVRTVALSYIFLRSDSTRCIVRGNVARRWR